MIDSGRLSVDADGWVWRRPDLSTDPDGDPVWLGRIEGRVRIEDDEAEDLEFLEEEWTRWHREGSAERAERWGEWRGSR